MSSQPTVIFFGVEMPETLLAIEIQNHVAPSLKEARSLAGRALAAKAVLLARARELGLNACPETADNGQEETIEEALIRQVLSEEVDAEAHALDAVRKIYDSQPKGFHTPPLLEASHILIAPEEHDDELASGALRKAEGLIVILTESPKRFYSLARTVSACPSGSNGGTLGQLSPGDVLDLIWKALLKLEPGHVGLVPIRTVHGWHVLRLDHRIDGRRLPFEHVEAHIKAQLEARAWTLAAARYVDALLRARASDIPAIGLTSLGKLMTGETPDQRVRFVLSDVFANPKFALKAMPADIMKRVTHAADNREISRDALVSEAVAHFLSHANDAGWTQIITYLRESDDPVPGCIAIILNNFLPREKTAHIPIQTAGK